MRTLLKDYEELFDEKELKESEKGVIKNASSVEIKANTLFYSYDLAFNYHFYHTNIILEKNEYITSLACTCGKKDCRHLALALKDLKKQFYAFGKKEEVKFLEVEDEIKDILANDEPLIFLLKYLIDEAPFLRGVMYDILESSLKDVYYYRLSSVLKKALEVFYETLIEEEYLKEDIYLISILLFKHFRSVVKNSKEELFKIIPKRGPFEVILAALYLTYDEIYPNFLTNYKEVSDLFINIKNYYLAFKACIQDGHVNEYLIEPYKSILCFYLYGEQLDLSLKNYQKSLLSKLSLDIYDLNKDLGFKLMEFFEVFPLNNYDLKLAVLNPKLFVSDALKEKTKKLLLDFNDEKLYKVDFYEGIKSLLQAYGEDINQKVCNNNNLQLLNLFKVENLNSLDLHMNLLSGLPFNFQFKSEIYSQYKTTRGISPQNIILTPNIFSNGDVIIAIDTVHQSEVCISFDENHLASKYHCSLCGNILKPCKHVCYLEESLAKMKVTKEAIANYEEILDNSVDFRNDRKLENNIKVATKKLIYYQELLSQVDENELLDKISLFPNIVTDDFVVETGASKIEFRIGNQNGSYILKLTQFLKNMAEGSFYSYGKKLAFKHNFKNLTPLAQKLYAYLLSAKNDSYIELSGAALGSFFKDLKTQGLEINRKFYTYKEPLKVHSEVNNEGIFKCSLDMLSTDKLFITPDTDYYFHLNNYYDLEFKNEKEKALCEDLLTNGSFSVLKNLDTFGKTIYPLIRKSCEINQEFGKNYDLITPLIKCYLSYDEGIIEAKTCFSLNDSEISYENLSETQKTSTLLYFNELKRLGFKNNKLVKPEEIINFLNSDLKALRNEAEVYLTKRLERLYKPKHINYHFEVKTNDESIMDVIFDTVDYSEQELYQVYNAYKKNKNYILLKDELIDLKTPEVVNMVEIINDLNLDPKNLKKEVERPLYHLLKLNADNLGESISSSCKALLKGLKEYQNEPYTLSKEIEDKLRNYQLNGFKWLNYLTKRGFGCILADDMGIGKTLETIALISSMKKEKPVLIVCPKNIIFNWEAELSKWAPKLTKTLIVGFRFERSENFKKALKAGVDVIIMSYEIVRNDLDLLKETEFELIVLDEAQNIKNPTSERSKAVKALKGKKKICLTGTPIENSLDDLWSIFDFLMPGYLYTHERFLKTLAEPNQRETLKKKIMPFVLRRTKQEVLKDLPPKTLENIYIAFNDEEKKIYQANILKARKTLENKNNRLELLSQISYLRELCVDPHLIYNNFLEMGSKTEYLLEMIDNLIEGNHKSLIFSQFTSYFTILEPLLQEKGIKYYVLTGKTPAKERLLMADSFNQDKDIKVFLISLKAGGVGLNLVGADTVIHVDPWWNIAAENQASDRAYRLGQNNAVTIYKLIVKNSIEERVINLQQTKLALAKSVLNENDEHLEQLSIDDYKTLLE